MSGELSSHTSTKTVFILDLMSMAFRHYHALSRQSFFTSLGFPTSAIYGIARALFQLYHQEKPEYMVAACDSKEPTFRHELYSSYKINRKEMPDELAEQLPKIFELLHLLGVPVLAKPGWEADDIIATLAQDPRGYLSQNHPDSMQVRIVTGDKDMMQLVNENTQLYQTNHQKTVLVGCTEVEEYFGVPPHKVVLAQSLIGDPTDDVPGVAGIGKATAAKLLKDVSSLDELYAQLHELKSQNLKEKLEYGKENAYISYQLVRLSTDVELNFALEDAQVHPLVWTKDNVSLNKFLQKCEFRSLRKRYLLDSQDLMSLVPFAPQGAYLSEDSPVESSSSSPSEPSALINHEQVQKIRSHTKQIKLHHESWTTQHSQKLIESVQNACVVVITITLGEDGIRDDQPSSDGCYGVCLLMIDDLSQISDSHSVLISWQHPQEFCDPQWLQCLSTILFASQQRTQLLVYDGKSMMHTLASWGLEVPEYTFVDLQIIEGLVLAKESSKSLDQAVKGVLGDWVNQQLCGDDASLSHRAYALALLYQKWQHPQWRLSEMQYVLWNIEIPLNAILFDMESKGVYVEKSLLNDYAKWCEAQMNTASLKIYELAGESFNIQSPKQLGEVIYGKLMLHKKSHIRLKKTKSQQFSTRESALVKLRPNELIEYVLRYRKLAKIKSTYAQALPDMINPHTHRLHTSFNQMGTATGRMSSERPNLQNIPIRTEIGREIRKAFCAPYSDRVMISADYSQIELRVLAHLSQDQNLIQAFINDQDIHIATAAHMLGQSMDEVSHDDREMAKAINYGIVYGMGAKRLAATIGSSFKRARDLITEYFRQFEGVAAYMKEVEEFASQHGYTMTYNGRMRQVDHSDVGRQSGVARNSPIQGTAADLMKLAMIRVYRALQSAQLDCMMLLQIHDELLFECDRQCLDQAQQIIIKEMEEAESFQVPLKVSLGVGEHWLAAH